MVPFQKQLFPAIVPFLLTVPALGRVQLGIDALQTINFAPLTGKRVGLITNQTGVDSSGTQTRVILRNARNVNLVALYTPEHGLDGTELAGRYVASRRDRVTGLTAHSLYGDTRKPTPQMLRGVDVLVYDMQDIGCRSYTYISTMIKCMEAAGEEGIEFMVLDRPNPIGGVRVQGPPIESRWISFVGQIPVPYVHGMTAGEIARMAVGNGWVRCKLEVIEMRDWDRRMSWPDTGLRWVQTSPNIPREMSPFYYVVTGLVGSLAGLETGVGGPAPFEVVAAPWLDAGKFTRDLQALDTPGVQFSEYRQGGFRGARLRIDPNTRTDLCGLAVYLLAKINAAAKPDLFARSRSKLEMFYKVFGSQSIRSDLEKRVSVQRIVAGWRGSLSRFEAERVPYLLYR